MQKIVDTNADGGPGNLGNWVDPIREESVYRLGLFNDDGLALRSVTCYRISEPRPGVKVFWLEDLTGAEKAPYSIDQLHLNIRNLGEFNGFQAVRKFQPQIPVGKDSYLSRWQGRDFGPNIERMRELSDRQEVQRVFRSSTLDDALKLFTALDQLNLQSVNLAHALSFGDSNAGNLFLVGEKTVAIDWATLTLDPIGVDAGCLIGSSISRGAGGTSILEAERELFSSYLAGLRSSGWIGNETDVRRAYFGQFGQYLIASGTWPRMLEDPVFFRQWKTWAEKRFDAQWDEILDLLASLVDSFPLYLDEVTQLLNQG